MNRVKRVTFHLSPSMCHLRVVCPSAWPSVHPNIYLGIHSSNYLAFHHPLLMLISVDQFVYIDGVHEVTSSAEDACAAVDFFTSDTPCNQVCFASGTPSDWWILVSFGGTYLVSMVSADRDSDANLQVTVETSDDGVNFLIPHRQVRLSRESLVHRHV